MKSALMKLVWLFILLILLTFFTQSESLEQSTSNYEKCVSKFQNLINALPSQIQNILYTQLKKNSNTNFKCCDTQTTIKALAKAFSEYQQNFYKQITLSSQRTKLGFQCLHATNVAQNQFGSIEDRDTAEAKNEKIAKMRKNLNMINSNMAKCLTVLNKIALQNIGLICTNESLYAKVFDIDSNGVVKSPKISKNNLHSIYTNCFDYLKSTTAFSNTLMNTFVNEINYLIGIEPCNYFSNFFAFDSMKDKSDPLYPTADTSDSTYSSSQLLEMWKTCASGNIYFEKSQVSSLAVKFSNAQKTQQNGLSTYIGRSDINYDIIRSTFTLEDYPSFFIQCENRVCKAYCSKCEGLIWDYKNVVKSHTTKLEVSCCSQVCVVWIQVLEKIQEKFHDVSGAEIFFMKGDPYFKYMDKLTLAKLRNANNCFQNDPDSTWDADGFENEIIFSKINQVVNNSNEYIMDYRLTSALDLKVTVNSKTRTLMDLLYNEMFIKKSPFYLKCKKEFCTLECDECKDKVFKLEHNYAGRVKKRKSYSSFLEVSNMLNLRLNKLRPSFRSQRASFSGTKSNSRSILASKASHFSSIPQSSHSRLSLTGHKFESVSKPPVLSSSSKGGSSLTSSSQKTGSPLSSSSSKAGSSLTSSTSDPKAGSSLAPSNRKTGSTLTSDQTGPSFLRPSSPGPKAGSPLTSSEPKTGSSLTSTSLDPKKGSSLTSTSRQTGSSLTSSSRQTGSSLTSSEPKTGSPLTSSEPKAGSPLTSSEPKTGSSLTSSSLQTGSSLTSSSSKTGSPLTSSEPKTGSPLTSSSPQTGSSFTSSNPQTESSNASWGYEYPSSFTSTDSLYTNGATVLTSTLFPVKPDPFSTTPDVKSKIYHLSTRSSYYISSTKKKNENLFTMNWPGELKKNDSYSPKITPRSLFSKEYLKSFSKDDDEFLVETETAELSNPILYGSMYKSYSYQPSYSQFSSYNIRNYLPSFYSKGNNDFSRSSLLKYQIEREYDPLDWILTFNKYFQEGEYTKLLNDKIENISIYSECCSAFCMVFVEMVEDIVNSPVSKRIYFDVITKKIGFVDPTGLTVSQKKCHIKNMFSSSPNAFSTCDFTSLYDIVPLKKQCLRSMKGLCDRESFEEVESRMSECSPPQSCGSMFTVGNSTLVSLEKCGETLYSLMLNSTGVSVQFPALVRPCERKNNRESNGSYIDTLSMTLEEKESYTAVISQVESEFDANKVIIDDSTSSKVKEDSEKGIYNGYNNNNNPSSSSYSKSHKQPNYSVYISLPAWIVFLTNLLVIIL